MAAHAGFHPPSSGFLSSAAPGNQTLLEALITFSFQVQPSGPGSGPSSSFPDADSHLPIFFPREGSHRYTCQCPLCQWHVPSSQSTQPSLPSPKPQDGCTWGQQWWLLSLILWGCEIWVSFIISPPTPRFSFGAISPPIFPNTSGKIRAGSALPHPADLALPCPGCPPQRLCQLLTHHLVT